MQVSIIITSYNVRDLLRQCLRSIFEYLKNIEFEVIVVDNASRDGSAEMVAREFPLAQLTINNRNLGFARANNQGIRMAQGKYILILNDDSELMDDSVEKLVQTLDRWSPLAGDSSGTDSIAAIGCKILNPDKTLQPSVRRWPGVWDQALILLKLHHLPWFKKCLDKYLAEDFDYNKEQAADQIMGAFMLIPREAIDKIGLFDEKFFCWFEEVDWCRRAEQAGLKIIYTPQAQIIHHGGASFKQLNWHKQMIWNHSLQRYFRKHEKRWKWFILWLLQPVSMVMAILIDHKKRLETGN